MKTFLQISTFILSTAIYAQVGINTTDPKATLDIVASNPSSPENTDGLLMPRVSAFPATNPSTDQNGMMVYLTATIGPNLPGIYVWNQASTSWERLASGSSINDADFYEEGTTNPPNDINDDIYTLGNVAIGKNTADFPIDIDATSLRGINAIIRGTDNSPRYGVFSEIANTGSGEHYGFYNLMSGSGNSQNYGLFNLITNNGSGANFGVRNQIINGGTGNKYGTFNNIAAFNANAVFATYNFVNGGNSGDRYGNYNQINNSGSGRLYGSYTTLGGAGTGIKFGDYITIASSVPGTHYGVYSDVNKAGSFAGYFRGRLAVGTTDFTSGSPDFYSFPSSRGTVNQVMQTNASGVLSWVAPESLITQSIDNLIDGKSDTNNTTVFLGQGAGANDDGTSNSNTGVGRFALENVVTGFENTAIGASSLRNNESNRNTAIGFGALFNNIGGTSNSGIGYRAMSDNVSGIQNLAIGDVAGRFVEGSNNVFLGYGSGTNNTNTTRGLSGSIFIGSNAGYNENNSNRLYIENSTANSNNALIYGEFDTNILRTNGTLQVGNPATTGYAFPNVDGAVNQIMQTDGNGVVSWVNATITPDADFYEEGTANPPNDINDDIYTLGNVAIGKNTADYPLDILSNGLRGVNVEMDGMDNNLKVGTRNSISNTGNSLHYGVLNDLSGTGIGSKRGVFNRFESSSNGPLYGVDNQIINTSNNNNTKIGVRNLVSANGNGIHIAVDNTVVSSGSGAAIGIDSDLGGIGTGDFYGNQISITGNGVNKYGSFVDIDETSPGNHYGLYSQVLSPTGFAGYFLGRLAIGTTTGNIYTLPSSRGSNGQIMQTDGSGNVSWVNLPTQTNDWSLTGNSGTNPAVNFIGTTDNQDISFRRNNIAYGRITQNNISLGSLSNSSITSGIANTAFGNGASLNVTTGSQNTTIGNLALSNTTTADNNTAVGARALSDNTIGERNVAMGVVASYRNTSGSNNVAIGNGALQENETGSSNVSIGDFSALHHETSNRNVFIGRFAAYGPNGGQYTSSNNVYLGYQSGYNSGSVSGNVFLGYQSGYAETGNNKLYIENTTSSTPLIYGEFDTNILRTYGDFQINDPANTIQSGLIQNDDSFVHALDANIDFGIGGNHIMLSSQEGGFETGGIHLDGDSVTIWSPADGNRALRILDEDDWNDNDGNPFDNAAELAYIDNNGQFVQASDSRRKQNLQLINRSLEKINMLNGYTYDYKINSEEKAKGEKPIKSSGVIAQELLKVFPEAVQVSEYGEYFVHYAGITPLLIEGIKELKKENDALKEQHQHLEARLAKLELLINNK